MSFAFAKKIQDLFLDNPLSDTRINRSANDSYFLAPRLPDAQDLRLSSYSYQTFTANSLAMTAQCDKNVTLCSINQDNASSDSLGFQCPEGFEGKITIPSGLAVGSWWQENNSYAAMSQHYLGNSTIDLGIVAFLQNVSILNATFINYTTGVQGSLLTARCTITAMNVSYSWSNTTDFASIDPASLADSSQAADIGRAPFLAGYVGSSEFTDEQKSGLRRRMAPATTINGTATPVDALTNLENALAYLGISLLGGTFQSMPVSELKLANSTVVTQVSKAPLFTLVILNLWYAAFAVLLSCLALYVLRDEGTRQDIVEVQQLITVNGLATAAVKRHRGNMSARNTDLRVGVEKADGEWQFRIWNVSDEKGESETLLAEEDASDEGHTSEQCRD